MNMELFDYKYYKDKSYFPKKGRKHVLYIEYYNKKYYIWCEKKEEFKLIEKSGK